MRLKLRVRTRVASGDAIGGAVGDAIGDAIRDGSGDGSGERARDGCGVVSVAHTPARCSLLLSRAYQVCDRGSASGLPHFSMQNWRGPSLPVPPTAPHPHHVSPACIDATQRAPGAVRTPQVLEAGGWHARGARNKLQQTAPLLGGKLADHLQNAISRRVQR